MTTFADLGLTPSTVQAVADTGYTQPTPIQEQAIPVALAGRDVLGIAQTGTGKTAAFTLPMIDRLSAGRAKARMPRSLVVAPTRELADQVAGSFEKYARGTKLSWALLIGGVSFKDQETKIDRGVDVLIATPGRLLDFYERRKIMLLDVKTLVVDEADRMLDMGFIPDLEKIFEITPKQKQTLFFSATMPPEITRLTGQFLKDPTRIEVSRPASTGENIKQFVAKLPIGEPKAKRMALRALIERAAPESGIIFCNRKSEVDIVAKSLQKYGYDAAPIHGDLDQSQRMKTLESFRAGELKLLVASDVAARGLDIPQVSDVFNYDVPHQPDDYVHRIGRTGRAGRLGETFMIVTPNDERSYDKVIKLTRSEPEEIVLELDWEEAARGAERDKERYGSGRGREGRDGRGRGDRDGGRSRGRDRGDQRERPVADHGQRASTEAISTPEPGEAAPVETRSAPPPRDEGRADEPRRDRGDRPRRDRGRGRDRDREARPALAASSDARAPDESQASDDVDARADAPTAPLAEASEPRRTDREEPRRAEREDGFGRRGERDRERGPRRDRSERPERGDRGDRFDRDDRPVTGFGGPADTPAFLLRSAASAIAALQKRGATQDTADEREDEIAEAPQAGSAEPASERGRSRRRRRGGDRPELKVLADATPEDGDSESALETAEAAEVAAAEQAVSSEETARPRRTRRRKAEVAPTEDGEPAATEVDTGELGLDAGPDAPAPAQAADVQPAPAKPRRTRKATAAEPEGRAGEPPAVEPDDAAVSKPRRARKASTAAEAPAAESAAAVEAPAAPKRPRARRKADAVAEEIAEALPGDVVPG